MNLSHSLHLEPYRDPYGLGFALIPEGRSDLLPCRQRTIVVVMFSTVDEQAQFVNGAGLVVPAKFNLDTLAPLMRRHAVRQEFGRVFGEGQFALKPAALKALESSGRLKSWVAHWLPEPAGYLDDAGAWATYIEVEQAAERDAFARNHAAAVELGQMRVGGVLSCPGLQLWPPIPLPMMRHCASSLSSAAPSWMPGGVMNWPRACSSRPGCAAMWATRPCWP